MKHARDIAVKEVCEFLRIHSNIYAGRVATESTDLGKKRLEAKAALLAACAHQLARDFKK